MTRVSPSTVPSSKIDVVARLLRLSWRYRSHVAQVVLLQGLLLVMTLGGLRFSGLGVDVIRHSLDPAARAPAWPLGIQPQVQWTALHQLLLVAAAILISALVASILNYAYSVTVGRLVHVEIVPNLRTELFSRLQRLSFRFFDSTSNGAIVNRVTVDVQMLRSFVDGVIIQGAVLVLSLSIFLAYMLSTHVKLTLVSLALTPLQYAVTRLFSRWAQPAYSEGRLLSDVMVRTLAEGIEGIQVTKVFGQAQAQVATFHERNLAVKEQQVKILRKVSRFAPTVDLLNQLNLAVLLSYGAYLVADGGISLGDLVIFAGLLRQFATKASGMADVINTLQQSMTGARRVFDIFDSPIEVHNPDQPVYPTRNDGHLVFSDVHFGYGDDPILKGITLEVVPGQCVGIFGATGAGKSSLLSLIPRFYDPIQGRVCIDGIDVRALDIDYLRGRIGTVFQESLLFRDTIANNIALGCPDATRAQIEIAAKTAGAHDFIAELPNGYDTSLEEGAVNLSGGQRQRIAIARALLLEPSILLLDDPTASIDTITEAEVLKSIDQAMAGRTTIVVSNRLNVLRRVDHVFVLAAGRVVEHGTHSQLMKSGGIYARTAALSSLDDGVTAGGLTQGGSS